MVKADVEFVEIKVKVPKVLREYVLALLQLRELDNEDECWTQFILDGAEAQVGSMFVSGKSIKENFKLNDIFNR